MAQEDTGHANGVVKWFDLAKGFGFVIADGVHEDILLHVNIVRKSGRSVVAAGDKVALDYERTPKGLQATELVDVVMAAASADGDAALHEPVAADVELQPARLKWFDKGKGYGFLNVFGDNEDVFVHVDVLRAASMMEVDVGEALSVVITRGAKGAAALSLHPWNAAEAWKAARGEADGS